MKCHFIIFASLSSLEQFNSLATVLAIFFQYDYDDMILSILSKALMLTLDPILGVRPSLLKVEGIYSNHGGLRGS